MMTRIVVHHSLMRMRPMWMMMWATQAVVVIASAAVAVARQEPVEPQTAQTIPVAWRRSSSDHGVLLRFDLDLDSNPRLMATWWHPTTMKKTMERSASWEWPTHHRWVLLTDPVAPDPSSAPEADARCAESVIFQRAATGTAAKG